VTHTHSHDGHTHSHEHDPHHVDARAGAVLDIGGDVGALLVATDPEMVGVEVEVCPVDGPVIRTHTAIHRREVGSSVSHSGLFPALAAGSYRLLRAKGAVPTDDDPVVTVVGGEVTTYRWTSSRAES
jgi:hypothetical protein